VDVGILYSHHGHAIETQCRTVESERFSSIAGEWRGYCVVTHWIPWPERSDDMNTLSLVAVSAALVTLTGAAQAAPLFQGRLANGTASSTCTVSGTTKCAMFYNTTLNITILNDWNIGKGFWSATAAPGSAQALAESAGLAQTGLTGWFLPTGNGNQVAGPLNQYQSIYNDVGRSELGLSLQFDGFVTNLFWSSTEYAVNPASAWYVGSASGFFGSVAAKNSLLYAVAVRPGDVIPSVPSVSVPEPQTLALTLLALGATVAVRRRQQAR
jgi:hypothetical protein